MRFRRRKTAKYSPEQLQVPQSRWGGSLRVRDLSPRASKGWAGPDTAAVEQAGAPSKACQKAVRVLAGFNARSAVDPQSTGLQLPCLASQDWEQKVT